MQMHSLLVHGVVKMMKRTQYGVVKIAIKLSSGSSLSTSTKESIKTQLKKYNVVSVKQKLLTLTTTILLTSNIKYNSKQQQKQVTH